MLFHENPRVIFCIFHDNFKVYLHATIFHIYDATIHHDDQFLDRWGIQALTDEVQFTSYEVVWLYGYDEKISFEWV